GFLEYDRKAVSGLVNQGWKDSNDSIFHADGQLAEPPIALCEVQAYVYAARRAAARLARDLGRGERARQLEAAAEELRRRFEEAFWSEELGTYALALDGDKKPCRVRASNAGHCLWAGIAAPERAVRVAAGLRAPEMSSGWGIRTLATSEVRYNPMSYHNGSVWPHDSALIGRGLADYGFEEAAGEVLAALFDASLAVDLHRLPELYCGFPRRPGAGPILYPVACSPQAWATGVGHLLIEACLGLSIDAPRGRVSLVHPYLPPLVDRVSIAGLRVGEAVVDLDFERHPNDVGVNVTRRQRDVEVVVVK
ncbi:MAG TPA: amylo-alpha-1,6-glucosidase, partial [Thermoanaerobaculia bacterium]|nr:amylo-alpha-1,6-glucosidase [Thermoanaerobaculia bacterium]